MSNSYLFEHADGSEISRAMRARALMAILDHQTQRYAQSWQHMAAIFWHHAGDGVPLPSALNRIFHCLREECREEFAHLPQTHENNVAFQQQYLRLLEAWQMPEVAQLLREAPPGCFGDALRELINDGAAWLGTVENWGEIGPADLN